MAQEVGQLGAGRDIGQAKGDGHRVGGEVVHRDDVPVLPPAAVGQHLAHRVLQDLQIAPGQLHALPVPVDEGAEEGQQGVGVLLLVGHVDVVGTEAPADQRSGHVLRVGVGEAAVRAGGPLHRGPHRHALVEIEVLTHADLLAVVERGGAGKGEQQRVDHAQPLRVAVEHRRQAAAQTPSVELHPLLGAELGEDLLPLGLAELVQGQLVVVAHERHPLAVVRDLRPGAKGVGQGGRVPPRQRQVQVLHVHEVEDHGQLLAVLDAEEGQLLLVGQIHLAQQHGPAVAPAREAAQVPQKRVGIAQAALVLDLVVQADREELGHRVDAEAVQTELQPEAHDLGDLVPDPRVADVEIGLVPVEAVQVPVPGDLVLRPDGVLLVVEDDHVRGVRRLRGAPDVVVAERVVDAGAGLAEPRMLVGGVVDDEVGDHPDAAVVGGADEVDEVARAPEARVHAVVVLDVVAVVLVGRGDGTASATGR